MLYGLSCLLEGMTVIIGHSPLALPSLHLAGLMKTDGTAGSKKQDWKNIYGKNNREYHSD